jgi:two-component system, response regulator YesN
LLKILIVDDEVLERKALTKIISNYTKDTVVIGEAPNGRLAIEMAEEHRPDIIFMDIKMPGIDGVQAVQEIREIDAAIRFIMVSAFNTFEYAKKVMQQGVKEYILKPSRKQDILDSLKRVTEEILEERKLKEEQQSLRDNLDRAVSIAQKEWVSSLLINQVQDITFEEWSQLLGVEISSGYIMLFLLNPKNGMELSISEKEQWYTWLKNSLKLMNNKQECIVGPMTDSQVPVLFLCKKTTERFHFKKNAQEVMEGMITLFKKEHFQGELKIAAGLPYHQAQELHRSNHDANTTLEQLKQIANRSYLFTSKQETADLPSVSDRLDIEKRLLDAIRQGDVNEVLYILESYGTRHASNEKLSVQIVINTFSELFILISRMLHELGISAQKKPNIDQTDTIERILEKGKAYLLTVVGQVQVWRNNHAKGMLHKAKEYIETHYADSLTLEQVAEYVELSPFYFSKLFKDRFGMTFIDYLTEIRINKAKAEMENPGKSLKEICYSVGYKDPNYFSRVFKKQTGLSPSEFRKVIVG